MTNETKTPAPLTAAEIEARKAIMAAADKPAETAPAKPADTPKPVEATTTAPTAEKPISEAVKGTATADVGKAVQAMVTAKQTPSPAPAVNGKPETKAATPDVGKPVNPANPKPQVLPDLSKGKAAQGGTKGGKAKSPDKAKGKPETKVATVSVSAAKPKNLSQRETAQANPDFVMGFDLTTWPQGEWAKFKPTSSDIEVARALGFAGALSMNEANLAVELGEHAHGINVYDVGFAAKNMPPRKGNGDHKMNIVLKGVRQGYLCFYSLNDKGAARAALLGPNGKPVDKPARKVRDLNGEAVHACYAVMLWRGGVEACRKAGVKMPKYMVPNELRELAYGKPVDAGKVLAPAK